MENKKKLIVIDGNSLLFRAYYATCYGDTSSIMRAKDGTPTNAIFAFSNMLSKILQSFEGGESIFVAFDSDKKTFRKEEFEDYKANRRPCPPELAQQFPISRELLSSLSIMQYELPGVEADDICGTVAKKAASEGYRVEVYTSDKDYLQLVDDSITVNLMKTGLSNVNPISPAAMKEQFGFSPKQIIDFKGLFGDSSDNLPGIPGIGEKTAAKLIQEYGDFDSIVLAAKDGRIKGKMGEKIVAGEELGRQCYRLATMKLDVELPFSIEDTLYDGYEFASVNSFAQKYELKQFLSRLPLSLKKGEPRIEEPEFHPTTNADSIDLSGPIGIALDLDPSDYHNAPVLGIGVASKGALAYLSAEELKKDARLLSALADPSVEKDVYDNKMTAIGLDRLGVPYSGAKEDILLAGYLLDSSLSGDPFLLYSLFGVDLSSEEEEDGLFAEGHPRKAARMAYYALHLVDKARKNLESVDAYKLYRNLELPLSFILANMEKEGFPLDVKTLQETGKAFQAKKDAIEEAIYQDAGYRFNIGSPKQVAELLFEKRNLPHGKNPSTSVEVLQELSKIDPICAKILEYRKYSKLLGTYVDGLIPHVKEDGKIHTSFNQAQTSTGRLSSSNPNLQNISARDEEGRLIKKAFFYPDGTKILSLDYGQIELRLLACMAGCKRYIDVFKSGLDVHAETARRIFNIPEGEPVPSALRRKAKAVNFAIIYGTTPFGLANQIEGTPKEASEVISAFYSAYPEIGGFLDAIISQVEHCGFVTTLFGRRRYLRDIMDSNYAKREAAKRAALNAPVQGTAADLIKMAMIQVDSFLREGHYKTKMVLQIHDELIFAGPEEELSSIKEKLSSIMAHAIELPLELTVEGSIGSTWYEAKE